MNWSDWWVWMTGAVLLAGLEVLVPSHIFLGFGIGAAVVGLLFLVGGPVAAALASSPAIPAMVFAAASLAAWLLLRRILGVRDGQVKIWDRDVNDD